MVAEIVSGYVPTVFAVPEMTAVPLPLLENVTPPGKAPVFDREGRGNPDVVTVKLKAVPTEAEALAVLVMVGAWRTVMVTV